MNKEAIASNIDLVSPLAIAKLIRHAVATDVSGLVVVDLDLLEPGMLTVSVLFDRFKRMENSVSAQMKQKQNIFRNELLQNHLVIFQ